MINLAYHLMHDFFYPAGLSLFVRIITAGYAISAIGRLIPVRHKQIPHYRPRPVRATFRYGAGILAIAALVAGCVSVTSHDTPARIIPRAQPSTLTGIVTNNVAAFDGSCSCHPQIAVRYIQWGQTFPVDGIRGMISLGAEPLIELEPSGVSLQNIVAGKSDAWLETWAHAIAAIRTPVLMSFAPEANGNWYSWGKGRSTAVSEVAAWRHVVTVFRHAGAANASWVWIVNQLWPGSAALPPLWPGAAYVNMTGVDGYFRIPSDTFTSAFQPTITELRKISNRPVLITETAARPAAGQTRALTQISDGIRRDKLAGFIWFDISKPGNGPAYGAWSLTGQALTDYATIAGKLAATSLGVRSMSENVIAWADSELGRITALIPSGWRTWYVPQQGNYTWHAYPPGGNRAAVNSDTPDGLVELIAHPESWLPAEIDRTRDQFEKTPVKWHDNRKFLARQLQALESERQRHTG